METTLTLGKVIRTRRIDLHLTQEELAERIGEGVRQAEVSRLERDRIALPRRARLEAIAAALNFSLGELLARSGWAGADGISWMAPPLPTLGGREAPRQAAIEENQSEDRIYASELSIIIDQARETISKTRDLLSQSDQTLQHACASVARTSRFGPETKS
jgi:transcriptional regulator with XRE-family HTH domain